MSSVCFFLSKNTVTYNSILFKERKSEREREPKTFPFVILLILMLAMSVQWLWNEIVQEISSDVRCCCTKQLSFYCNFSTKSKWIKRKKEKTPEILRLLKIGNTMSNFRFSLSFTLCVYWKSTKREFSLFFLWQP